MADTVRTLSALQTLLADNSSGAISPQDVRDFLVSVFPRIGAAASVADGGTIIHGLGATPTSVQITGSVAGELVAVTAIGATTFTVAIKTLAGIPGTTQTIYWEANY